ncbi:hypothetical protein RN001_008194 [Aquatica leii]|uniref:Uncharacterized protein n=1 Tax=Aquatica leii TaxID=1421715 RepID=A0AAN7SP59_9COLE|nr:hypothetical protein RN001_008194 [Aquatica leii]
MDLLLEVAAIGGLVNVELAIINELAEPRQERFLRATKYERLNLDNLTEEECINNFRFRREHLGRLANCLNLPAYIISGNRHRTTGIEEIGCSIMLMLWQIKMFHYEIVGDL